MISKLAYVHPKAEIGKDVTVEPFAYIAGDAVIGDDSWIGPGAVILDGARIGKNCKIHTAAVIAGVPQDLKFKGEYSTAEIGDNTTVRESATVNRGTAAKGRTVVGSNTLLMACSHIGHDCTVGNNVVIVNAVLLAGEVEVGDWAILGGQSGAHQFTRIGMHAMVAAKTFITKDIPPYVKAAHDPIAYVGANTIGLRRRGFDSDQVHEIQEMFRILFQSGYGYSKACDMVMDQFPQTQDRDMIVNFIRESKRGILKPYNPLLETEE